MSLQTLREDFLYDLLPAGVVNLDVRGLLQALVGGYQDHLEDLRSYIQKYETFVDPLEIAPEGEYNSLLVIFAGDQGQRITRFVNIDQFTPDDEAGRLSWVASAIGVDTSSIESVTPASDQFKAVDSNLLEYLAATIGAVVYKTDTSVPSTDSSEILRRQRQAVESYFPRLKIKGTPKSFVQLARAVGFDDAAMLPLWGRASPRLPSDIGNALNDEDFSHTPQHIPSVEPTIFYDPNDLSDGPYYLWESGTLTNDIANPNFWSSVNSKNPFISVKDQNFTELSASVVPPAAGTYTLVGGGPHVRAAVSPSGSGVSFQAITEGASFNGLNVVVTASGTNRFLSIFDRLSSIKYRTSYYDLILLADLERSEELSRIKVQPNKDLEANPTLIGDAPAVSPYYPFSGSTIIEQVKATESQLDTSYIRGVAVQATPYFEEVRPATRYLRRLGVGYVADDSVRYSLLKSRVDLFTTTGAGTYYGDVGESDRLLGDYTAQIGIEDTFSEIFSRGATLDDELIVTLQRLPEAGSIQIILVNDDGTDGDTVGQDSPSDGGYIASTPAGSGILLGGLVDYTRGRLRMNLSTSFARVKVQYKALTLLSAGAQSDSVVLYSGTQFSGQYNLTTGHYDFIDSASTSNKGVSILFGATDTEVVNSEPGTLYKTEVGPYWYTTQPQPEDYIDIISSTSYGTLQQEFHDEYPWRRPLVIGGVEVHHDYYDPPVDDIKARSSSSEISLTDHAGVEYDIVGLDKFDKSLRAKAAVIHAIDVIYLIDVSISMGPYIDALKSNIKQFNTFLVANGFDARYAYVKYGNALSSSPLGNGVVLEQDLVDYDTFVAPGGNFDLLEQSPTGAIEFLSHAGIEAFTASRRPYSTAIIVALTNEDDDSTSASGSFAYRDQLDQLCFDYDARFFAIRTPIGDPYNVATTIDYLTARHGGASYDLGEFIADPTGFFAQFQQDVLGSAIPSVIRTLISPKITTSAYAPGQAPIATSDTGNKYCVGLVNGVMIADPVAFRATGHLVGLHAWYPFNEHPEDDLGVRDTLGDNNLDHTNVNQVDREWSSDRGWFLVVRNNAILRSLPHNLGADVTLAFRIRPYKNISGGIYKTVIEFGPVSFDLDDNTTTLRGFVRDIGQSRVQVVSFTLIPNQWNFVYVRSTGGQFYIGNSSSEVRAPLTEYVEWSDSALVVSTDNREFGISDFRVWSMCKSTSDMSRLMTYTPKSTIIPYKLTYFLTAGHRERWGLKMLTSGVVVPFGNAAVGNHLTKWVTRYKSTGRYDADTRFKEVGLGDGEFVSGLRQLGTRWYTVPALGQIVASGAFSALPGINALWDENLNNGASFDSSLITFDNTYLTFDNVNGTIVSKFVPSITFENPTRDRIWMNGVDGMYQVTIENDDGYPYLKPLAVWQDRRTTEYASAGSLQHMHAPTGAQVEITDQDRMLLSVEYHPSGTLHVTESAIQLPFARPDVYLYNMTQAISIQSGTNNWDSRTEFGLQRGIAAIDSPGHIRFVNDGNVFPGPHELKITSKLIGQAGVNFEGFDVDVTLGTDTFPLRLLQGVKGENVSKEEKFEVMVSGTLLGKWMLDINWLNDLDITEQGVTRDLGVLGYRFSRINPLLYKVINSGSLQPVDIHSTLSENTMTGGGWLAKYSSSGSLMSWTHESDQDTRRSASFMPISDLLNTSTNQRLESVVLNNLSGNIVHPTAAAPASPNIIALAVVADTMSTTWLWVGGVTSSTAVISAKVSASGLVQAVLSTSPNFREESIIRSEISLASSAQGNVATMKVVGLSPDTTYYYAVGSPASPDLNAVGTLHTFKSGVYSFRFATASCSDSNGNSEIWDFIRSQDPLFMMHTGDLHYDDITADSVSDRLNAIDSVHAQPRFEQAFRSMPILYMWDDHDFCGNNSNGSSAGKNSAQQMYRMAVPSYYLPATHSDKLGEVYYAFECGRAYFIVTDLRSEKGSFGTTVMGATQKEWFKQQLIDANGRYGVIFWVNTTPWISGTSSPYYLDDGWGNYEDEHTELADFIKDANIRNLVIVSGDMHALAYDDGTNSDFSTSGEGCGLPVLQAAPLHQHVSHKGGPYSSGTPIPSGGVAKQVGIVDVTDYGTRININFTGYNSDGDNLLSFSFDPADYPV